MDLSRIAALLTPFLGDAILTAAQLSQVSTYLDLLLRWNARMNLTAVRDAEQIVTRHFGESLFAARHLHSRLTSRDSRLLDIGSGAGFPGLPIKIYHTALTLTLLESNHRKATFLREVVRALALSDADVVTTRAEDYVPPLADKNKPVGPGAVAGAAPASKQLVAAAGVPPVANVTVTLRAVERFDEILPTAVRLLEKFPARHRSLALLIGVEQVPRARDIARTLAWSDPLLIPRSSQRVLLIGRMG